MAANMSFVGSLPGSGPRRASCRPSSRSTLLLRRTKSAAAIENQSASDVASTAADRSSFLEESFDSPRSGREPTTTSMPASSRAGSPTCSATSDGDEPSQLDDSSDKAPLSRADVEWLLGTLSRTQREHFQRPAFYADCRRKFASLDRDDSGFLEEDELGPAVLEMFPALQQGILVEGSDRSLPPFSTVRGLLEAFDTDMDGKVSIDEFPDFVRFCQAWRLHLYFSAPREEFRAERRRAAAASAATVGDEAAGASRRRPLFGCPLQCAEVEAARRLFPKTPGAGLGSGASSASAIGRPASAGMRRSASTASGMLPQLLPNASRHSSSSRRSSPRKGNGSSASGIPSGRRPPAAPAALVEQRPANSSRRSRLPSAASSRCPSINSQRPSSACSSQQGRRPRSASGATASTAASSSSSAAASRCASVDVRDGFGEAPSQKRAPKLLDPADLARRLPGGSKSTSGLPLGASRKRRARSKLVSAADPEQILAEQLEALATVVDSVGSTRPLAEMSNTLLRHVLARDGTQAFPQPLVEAVAEDVLAARTKLMQPGARDLEPAGARATSLVVRLLRALEEKSPLELGDIVGQILWRHRRSLRHTRFAKVAEDVSWIAEKESTFDVLDMVDGVYRGLTMAEAGGRMMKPQWNKAVKFILRNPVLGPRINHSDIDRLFYCETHRAGATVANPTISPSEFKLLLLQLADASKIHPHMVFVCVGVHAEELIQEASAAAE